MDIKAKYEKEKFLPWGVQTYLCDKKYLEREKRLFFEYSRKNHNFYDFFEVIRSELRPLRKRSVYSK